MPTSRGSQLCRTHRIGPSPKKTPQKTKIWRAVADGTTQSSEAEVAARAGLRGSELRERPRDIRAIRLGRRRAVSALTAFTGTTVLIAFDLLGLIAGVYAALALRE